MKKPKVFKKTKNLKMSKRSEKALDESIKHWFGVRDEKESATGQDCELCREFWCSECPVDRKSRGSGCLKTPFYEYHKGLQAKVSEPKRKRLAQDEINFLQSCYY